MIRSRISLGVLVVASGGCVGGGFDKQDASSPASSADADVGGPSANDAGDSGRDSSRPCRRDSDCDNGSWCDGDEICLDGQCAAGEERGAALRLSCATVVCDEASRTVTQRLDATLCPAPAPGECVEDTLVERVAVCDPDVGCTEVVAEQRCPVRVSASCSDNRLTSVERGCRVADGVAQCTEVDSTTPCSASATCRNSPVVTHVAAEECVVEQGACIAKETVCVVPEPACLDGVQTAFEPTCDAEDGCGAEPVSAMCTVKEAGCTVDGSSRIHYRPTCDGPSCDPDGVRVVTACEPMPPRCSNGALTTHASGCSAGECTQDPTTTTCPTKQNACVAIPNSRRFSFVSYPPRCASADSCAEADASEAETLCNFRSVACTGAVWNGRLATCSPEDGCGLGDAIDINCAAQNFRRCEEREQGLAAVTRTCTCVVDGPAPCRCMTRAVGCSFGCTEGRCDLFTPGLPPQRERL